MSKIEQATINVIGHVHCSDIDTGEVITDDFNAVNFENVIIALTTLLGGVGVTQAISAMAFGNGGIEVNALGEIEYKSPNVNKQTDTLYNQTYEKSVNNTPASDPNNNVQVIHYDGDLYSDIVTTCTLENSEPIGQNTVDQAASLSEPFVFNEIGLTNDLGTFLTHYISSPIEKAANRRYRVVYTLRITTGTG